MIPVAPILAGLFLAVFASLIFFGLLRAIVVDVKTIRRVLALAKIRRRTRKSALATA